MANPIWQSMKFVIARRELFIRYFILIQYYIFAEHFSVLLAASWWLWMFLTFFFCCSFTSKQFLLLLSLCWLSLFISTHKHIHTLTFILLSQTHVSALSNIILFHIVNKNISLLFSFFVAPSYCFPIEKDFKLRNYGGNLSLCGPQYSNKVFLSCFFFLFDFPLGRFCCVYLYFNIL